MVKRLVLGSVLGFVLGALVAAGVVGLILMLTALGVWLLAGRKRRVAGVPSEAPATLAPVAGGSGRGALRTLRRDGAAHTSPNAGRCEAAFAGALGVRLGGTNVYQGQAERRGTLGDGPAPSPADIDRAIRISRSVIIAATVLSALIARLSSAPRARVHDRRDDDHLLCSWLSRRSPKVAP